jgi:ribonuclease P protein component
LSGRYVFTRRQRLLKGTEFAAVFTVRRMLRSKAYLVMSRPNDLGHARLGMVVAKRQFKRAVDRNRIRRMIRETFRLYGPDLPALDVVIRVLANPEKDAVTTDLASLLAKLK